MLRKFFEWNQPSLTEKYYHRELKGWGLGDKAWLANFNFVFDRFCPWQPPGCFPLKLDEGDSGSFSVTWPYSTLDRVICKQYSHSRFLLLFSCMCSTKKQTSMYRQGCTTCCSLAAGLRGNGERMGKWGENEEMKRDLLFTFPHFLFFSSLSIQSISYIILSQNVKYGTFCRECHKKVNIRAMGK